MPSLVLWELHRTGTPQIQDKIYYLYIHALNLLLLLADGGLIASRTGDWSSFRDAADGGAQPRVPVPPSGPGRGGPPRTPRTCPDPTPRRRRSLAGKAKRRAAEIPGLGIQIAEREQGLGSVRPAQVESSANDPAALQAASGKNIKMMEKLGGFPEIASNVPPGTPPPGRRFQRLEPGRPWRRSLFAIIVCEAPSRAASLRLEG